MRDFVDKCKDKDVVRIWNKFEKDIKVGTTKLKGEKAYYSPMYDNINFYFKDVVKKQILEKNIKHYFMREALL